MDRRDFVGSMCAGGLATFGMPVVRFARVRQGGRLVFVLLRGGFDGLAAVVPYGDPAYRALRGELAFDASQLTPLNDLFGLAPGLASLGEFWQRDELVVLQAMAIPYRTRSHFDGQAVLETGLDRPIGSSDGWLNRLLQVMPGERSGLAVASGMPRSMSGPFEVRTWSPAQLGVVDDAYLERLATLYRRDRALAGRWEAAVQQQADVGEEPMARGAAGRGAVTPLLEAAARLMRAPNGPNVAAVEFSGWDTHANQGLVGGALDRLLGQLAGGLGAFRTAMGDDWAETTVVVMTEFGRTASPNGTRGTDHGTAGAGFVIGPKVARSAVVSDWPGLSTRALYEGRDLAPTLDTRSVLKGVIGASFDLTAAQVDRVLPGAEGLPGWGGIVR
ncbi:MAG: DUF1501 domain-containing protein [Gemmatimonadaceae bacterium]